MRTLRSQHLVIWSSAALLAISITSAVVWFTRRAGASDKQPVVPAAHDAPRYVGSGVCLACHAEQANRERLSKYRNAMMELQRSPDVGCESCHGPGSRHVQWARQIADDGN